MKHTYKVRRPFRRGSRRYDPRGPGDTFIATPSAAAHYVRRGLIAPMPSPEHTQVVRPESEATLDEGAIALLRIALKDASYRELQVALKTAGEAATGTTQELMARAEALLATVGEDD